MGGLAFGARSFLHDGPDGEVLAWDEYTIGLGGSPRPGYGWGVSYSWSRADEGLASRHERLAMGSIRRSRLFSLGIAWLKDTRVGESMAQADLGIRPFGPRLTLFADATFDRDLRWDHLGTRAWRTGYGIEAHPIRGLAVGAKALNTGEVGVRLSLGAARGSHPGAAVNLDRGGGHGATTYWLETGSPEPDLGLVKSPPRYKEIDLRGPIAYRRYRLFDSRRTLLGTLREIDALAADPGAGGVVLNLSGLAADGAMLWELREQLAGLRASGKKVIVYLDRAGMGQYAFASVADQIWMDPVGELDLRGLVFGRTYLRGALDKLGLGVDEWRFFTYKSAFESLSRESMSAADREQGGALIDDIYEHLAGSVCAARGISREAWDRLVNEQGVLLPREALEAGLVDSLGTFEQARKAARRAAPRATADASSAPLATLFGDPVWEPMAWGDRPQIAVLYALGVCEMEEGIKGRSLAKKIRAAGRDRSVKAIVLRADSPGGDPLPSDLVAREMKEAAKRKPVIVSQGRVAGSGGYWISMYGDSIVASPVTVTGSIGVIGGWIWNQGLGEKLGIAYDHVQRGDHADVGSGMVLPLLGAQIPERALTPRERERMEELIRALYADFVDKVAEGRGLTAEQVDGIGQGRIWSGLRGREIGLVDEIGGLWHSLAIARDAAGIPAGRGIALTEGPSLGLFHFPLPELKLFGVRLGAPRGGGETAAATPPAAAAALELSPAEFEHLRRIALARGLPLLLMEPFEIRDAGQRW
ncbi:MAG: S49 family peptidase [Candidatus Eisenbacteria bacterium]|uniref:S49 family peptidase n=1 Tax=Eiseniibacteriota bacterium TaxID=2212470 RepID=A0A937XCS3_UNCEI|nr:S49 family peptidase [Candidatus Eisenbacteria bacterium]